MKELRIITKINAPAAKVWSIIGAVGGVDQWSPLINTCTLSSSSDGGLQRTCTSEKGDLKEQILLLDNKNRVLSYAIVEQQFFPIDDLQTTIKVNAENENTVISTEVTYSLRDDALAAEIEAGLKEVYALSYGGIQHLVLETI